MANKFVKSTYFKKEPSLTRKLLFCTQFYIIKIIQHRAANRKKKSPLLGKEEAIFAGQDSADLRGRIRGPPLHL